MAKYEKFDLLEVAFKKLGEEYGKALDNWEAELKAEHYEPKKSAFARGNCEGIRRAREIILDLQLTILKEEEK